MDRIRPASRPPARSAELVLVIFWIMKMLDPGIPQGSGSPPKRSTCRTDDPPLLGGGTLKMESLVMQICEK